MLFIGCTTFSHPMQEALSTCIQQQESGLYQALQQRATEKVVSLLDESMKQNLQQTKQQIEAMYATVPAKAPLAVEVPLEENVKDQHICFYVYDDTIIRFRLVYADEQKHKVTGFWVMDLMQAQQ